MSDANQSETDDAQSSDEPAEDAGADEPEWADEVGPEAIEVDIQYRAGDLAAPSQWNMLRGGWLKRRGISAVVNAGVGAFLFFDPFDIGSAFEFGWMGWLWWGLQWLGLVGMIVGAVLIFRLAYTMYVIFRAPGKLWPGLKKEVAPAHFVFDADGLRLSMEEREASYGWADFVRVERWRDCFLMETRSREWIIVPRRGFEDDDESRFMEMVREHDVPGELSG